MVAQKVTPLENIQSFYAQLKADQRLQTKAKLLDKPIGLSAMGITGDIHREDLGLSYDPQDALVLDIVTSEGISVWVAGEIDSVFAVRCAELKGDNLTVDKNSRSLENLSAFDHAYMESTFIMMQKLAKAWKNVTGVWDLESHNGDYIQPGINFNPQEIARRFVQERETDFAQRKLELESEPVAEMVAEIAEASPDLPEELKGKILQFRER
ncbi:MAG TPA: hypothetical protein VLF68_01080 [Candidatus Saccharimonadales bacterium]|nr:hypothetical protein [Candidatus Saccharimonadales bacterium]